MVNIVNLQMYLTTTASQNISGYHEFVLYNVVVLLSQAYTHTDTHRYIGCTASWYWKRSLVQTTLCEQWKVVDSCQVI